MDNPYIGIVQTMRNEGAKNNPPSMNIGTIKTVNPITIEVNDLILYQDDLYISDMLLSSYLRKAHIKGNATGSENGTLTTETQYASGGSGESSFSSHNHQVNDSYNSNTSYSNFTGDFDITLETCLRPGDLVALIPVATMQRYIALCKVVAIE